MKYLPVFEMSVTPVRWPVWARVVCADGNAAMVLITSREHWDSAVAKHHATVDSWFYPDAQPVPDLVPRAELEAAQADAEAKMRMLATMFDRVDAAMAETVLKGASTCE